jgi:hypothetical protein
MLHCVSDLGWCQEVSDARRENEVKPVFATGSVPGTVRLMTIVSLRIPSARQPMFDSLILASLSS